jgi:hypothetical protein
MALVVSAQTTARRLTARFFTRWVREVSDAMVAQLRCFGVVKCISRLASRREFKR